MGKENFIKGPWVAFRPEGSNGFWYVDQKNGIYKTGNVAVAYADKDGFTAKLISAAPDMYKELVQIQIEGGLSQARHRSIGRLLAVARGEKK